MSFDGEQKYAATSTNKPSIGLRSFAQEILSISLIVSSASIVFTLVEIKHVIERGRHIDEQIVTISNRTASLADRVTVRLEEFEESQVRQKD